jgi:hypothetical protein
MLDTTTEKNLNGVTIMDNKKVYKNIMDNCDMYMVKPNGNKAWLFENWVLLEWNFCNHSNPFESWKLPNAEQAKEFFNEIQNNNNDY